MRGNRICDPAGAWTLYSDKSDLSPLLSRATWCFASFFEIRASLRRYLTRRLAVLMNLKEL